MKFILLAAGLFIACSNKTPEELAKKSCDCYREAKSFHNTTKQLNKIDKCFRLVQDNLQQLQQIGIDNDWNDAQIENARKRFDKIYNKCNDTTDSERN